MRAPAPAPTVRDRLAGPWLVPAIGVVLAVQAVVVLFIMSRSYYFAEDFTFLQLFDHQALGYDALTRVIFGHLTPGFIVINKYVGTWFGASWTPAEVITLVIQAAGTVAFARFAIALAGRRWWTPIAVAAFGLSLVGLNTTPWWGATTTIQATLVGCVATWDFAIRYAATRRWPHLLGVALAYAVALLFWEKSLLTCFYLGTFALLVGVRSQQGSWRERLREVLRAWPLWAVLAAISLVHLSVYLRGGYLDAAGPSPTTGHTLDYLRRAFTDALAPSLVGVSPDSLSATVAPWAYGLASLVVGAVVVSTAWASSLARRTWLWWLVASIASQGFVARGRLGLLTPVQLSHDLRYSLDALLLFLVAALVAVPAAVRRVQLPRRPAAVALGLVAVVVLSLWAHSVSAIADKSAGHASQRYFREFRGHEVPAGTRFIDLPVPGGIVPPVQAPWNQTSHILALLDPAVQVSDDPTGTDMVRYDGSVVPFKLVPDVTTVSHDACASGATSATVLTAPAGSHTFETGFLTFHFRAASKATLLVSAETPNGAVDVRGTGQPLHVDRGSGERGLTVVPKNFTSLVITSVHGGKVCFTSATYGQADY